MKSTLLTLIIAIGISLPAPVQAEPLPDSRANAGEPAQIVDLCRLIEALPGAKDPVRKSSAFRSVIRGLSKDLKATSQGKSLSAKRAQAHTKALEKALSKTLALAQKAFRLEAEERWTRKHQSRAKKFLKGHVFTRAAPLRVGAVGFEPSPSLRALLLWSACWAGDTQRVITYGRGATHADEGAARALAALTLGRLDRREEASELLSQLAGEGFLVALAQWRLAGDQARRTKHRALARRRATTPWQREAVGLQPIPEDEAH